MEQKCSTENVQRPVKTEYLYATLGSKTRMGGEVVTANETVTIENYPVACVGDIIRYPDGTESKIVSGAGFAAVLDGQPIAIVGSTADNGDTIISTLQNSVAIACADGEVIPGLLQPGYVVPLHNVN